MTYLAASRFTVKYHGERLTFEPGEIISFEKRAVLRLLAAGVIREALPIELTPQTQKPADCPPSPSNKREMVTCGNCCHFIPDPIGSGQGLGCCKAGMEREQDPLWPNKKRHCVNWLASTSGKGSNEQTHAKG